MTKLNLCSSVLKMVFQGQITEEIEIMTENFRKVQNESEEIILNMLKRNINKPHISAWIYRMSSLVKYSKDNLLHNKIKELNKLSDKVYLYDFLRNKFEYL